MRTITLTFSETTGPVHFRRALSYLCSWALDSYDTVTIVPHFDNDLMAIYTDSNDPKKKYIIGAIWDRAADTFSYHS
jgi:hypothetical protein